MKAKTLYSTFVVLTMLAIAPLELSARTLGMVADDTTDSVTVFDADTHAVLGTVPITSGEFFGTIGDVLITPDLKRGFVTNGFNQVFVIDLTTSPPSLAGGTNPIPISSFGNDLSISPNGKFLVVSSGVLFTSQPISVIDIHTQTEIGTFFTDADTVSVDVCSDGSVLAASFALLTTDSRTVRRLTLSDTGTLTDTGEVLSIINPINVYCAPGAQSGVVIQLGVEGAITSFTIPGLSEIDARLSEKNAFTGAINLAGNRVFMRSYLPGLIDVFEFNSATGALGASPLLTIPIAPASPSFIFGIEYIALHPNSTKLFVSEPNAVNVYNTSTGVLLTSITDPAIVDPTGVTVQAEADPCALPPPPRAIVGTNGPNILNGTSGNDTIFGLGGNDVIDGKGGDDLICGGAGNDQMSGNAGNDTIIGGSTGSDQITGGTGDDTLNAQDGVSGNDQVNGGTHVSGDTCTADPGDVVSSCNP